MALSDYEQIQQLIRNSKYILIVFAGKENGDSIAGALALKLLLEKEHKQADIAADNFCVPKNLKFLKGINSVKDRLSHLQKFIIKIDASHAPIDTISYDVKDNWLSIYLTPEQGVISKQDLRTAQSTFKYDLIITLNTPDLESLGNIFDNNTDLFYRSPIINIDHHANNERYGQVNLVDLTATSAAEIIYGYLKQTREAEIDSEIATALLAGMIIATKSFKISPLAPHTLHYASELIERGAEREKIIQHLYHTRTIAALKLWGEALTHLQFNSALKLAFTALTHDDFVRSGATEDDLTGLIEELISNSPEASLALVLYEQGEGLDKKIRGVLSADKNYNAELLVKSLSPSGDKKNALFTITGLGLKEAEEKIIKAISDAMPRI